MKRAILIGFALAVASSSAYAYKVVSQGANKVFGSPIYNILCDNGVKTVVNHGYYDQGNTKKFATLDQAAKYVCKEK